MDVLLEILEANSLVTAFAVVGLTMYVSYFLSDKLTKGRLHGSAIAIILGLALAYFGGVYSGGENGLADLSIFSGLGIMGGAMLRDLAIVSTAFGASFTEFKKAGLAGIVSLFVGVFVSFMAGVSVAFAFGYTDAASLTTIGGGATTYIVGPVAGTAVGASSEVITLSIAAGLVKSIIVMIGTPLIAKYIHLDNPRSAIVFGGLMGTTSGVAAGLAATDPKLVPYGAMTATFFTGLGCLLVPSVLFLLISLVAG